MDFSNNHDDEVSRTQAILLGWTWDAKEKIWWRYTTSDDQLGLWTAHPHGRATRKIRMVRSAAKCVEADTLEVTK